MQLLALHHNSRWMVKSVSTLWTAEKSHFKPQAIPLNLFLYSKQSAYHELTNCKLYYFLKWLQDSQENWGFCLQKKNSPCNSSETLLPTRTQPHHQDGLFGPWQILAALLGLLNTSFNAVITVFELFLHKSISNNVVTDIYNWHFCLGGVGFSGVFFKERRTGILQLKM